MKINRHNLKRIINCALSAIWILVGVSLQTSLAASPSLVNKNAQTHSKANLKKEQVVFKPPKNLAHLLGWVVDPTKMCQGYFTQPAAVAAPLLPPVKNPITYVQADGSTTFLHNGETILRKNVVMTQVGKIGKSDIAHVFRNVKTGKITHIKARGHVRLIEHDRLVVAESGSLNLNTNTTHLYHALYHFYNAMNKEYHAWGTAKDYAHLTSGNTVLHDATYSVCNPIKPSWQMHAKKLTLNHKTHEGVARDVVIRFKNIPILYTPYISFSLDHTRKSGFLTPKVAYSSHNGFRLHQPYYWNIAPNYDLLLIPGFNSKRGFVLDSLFRYLTVGSKGNIEINATPHDKEFKRFKADAINDPSVIPLEKEAHLSALEADSNARGFFHFDDTSTFNKQWNGQFSLNYVTDSYFLRDYAASQNQLLANQLLNQALVNYSGGHWQSSFLLQAYQTVHPYNGAAAYNQYRRLPEVDFMGNYYLWNYGVNLSGQLVDFTYQSDFNPLTYTKPVGLRVHLSPSVSRIFDYGAGYITPRITIDNTIYAEQPAVNTPSQARPTVALDRTLPMIDVDTGLYLQRDFSWKQKAYLQTFEPRIFYLYVPYLNQDKYPVFDAQLLPFSYTQLFTLNEYTGFDRVQNANQLTFGVTNRVLTQDSASQILEADLGIVYYMTSPKVNINEPLQPINFSPLVGQVTFYPFNNVTTTGTAAWDVTKSELENTSLIASYTRNGADLLSLGYEFIAHDPPNSFDQFGDSEDTSLLNVGAAWALTDKVSALGYVYYDLSKKRTDNYYVGLQYNSCCYAFRFIYNQQYIQDIITGNSRHFKYNNVYYFQFELKGLGGVGKDPDGLLQSTMASYKNIFLNQ